MENQKKPAIQLDPSKLMGFESSQKNQTEINSQFQSKVGGKPVQQLQAKVGTKIGMKRMA